MDKTIGRQRKLVVALTVIPALIILIRLGYTHMAAWYRELCGPTMPFGIRGFSVAPSDKILAFSTTDGRMYSFDLATRRATRLLQGYGVDQLDPSFSRDGRFLVYVARSSDNDAARHVFVADLWSKGKARQVTDGGDDSVPSFSDDGRFVVFSRIIPYPRLLGPAITSPFAIDLETKKEERLTTDTYAAVSADGYVSVSTPHFAKRSLVVDYYGSEWSVDSSDQRRECNLFEIAVDKNDNHAVGAPRELALGTLEEAVEDAYLFPDRDTFVLSKTSTMKGQGGLLLFSRQTGHGSRILEAPSDLPCYKPIAVDNRTVYFLAEMGSEPSGRALTSLWKCTLGSDKSAQEVISLAYLEHLP